MQKTVLRSRYSSLGCHKHIPHCWIPGDTRGLKKPTFCYKCIIIAWNAITSENWTISAWGDSQDLTQQLCVCKVRLCVSLVRLCVSVQSQWKVSEIIVLTAKVILISACILSECKCFSESFKTFLPKHFGGTNHCFLLFPYIMLLYGFLFCLLLKHWVIASGTARLRSSATSLRSRLNVVVKVW